MKENIKSYLAGQEDCINEVIAMTEALIQGETDVQTLLSAIGKIMQELHEKRDAIQSLTK